MLDFSPFQISFQGLEWYDPAWRVVANFIPAPKSVLRPSA